MRSSTSLAIATRWLESGTSLNALSAMNPKRSPPASHHATRHTPSAGALPTIATLSPLTYFFPDSHSPFRASPAVAQAHATSVNTYASRCTFSRLAWYLRRLSASSFSITASRALQPDNAIAASDRQSIVRVHLVFMPRARATLAPPANASFLRASHARTRQAAMAVQPAPSCTVVRRTVHG